LVGNWHTNWSVFHSPVSISHSWPASREAGLAIGHFCKRSKTNTSHAPGKMTQEPKKKNAKMHAFLALGAMQCPAR
jgi:hypothetical protein